MYSDNELRHLVAGWVNPTQASVEGCNPGTVAKSKEALLKNLKVSGFMKDSNKRKKIVLMSGAFK